MADKTHVRTAFQDGVLVAVVKPQSVSAYESEVILEDIVAEAPVSRWRIALDCSEVEFISSAGIGMMVTLHTQCKANKGSVAVFGIKPAVLEVLKITKLNKLFKIVPDLPTAIKKLS